MQGIIAYNRTVKVNSFYKNSRQNNTLIFRRIYNSNLEFTRPDHNNLKLQEISFLMAQNKALDENYRDAIYLNNLTDF